MGYQSLGGINANSRVGYNNAVNRGYVGSPQSYFATNPTGNTLTSKSQFGLSNYGTGATGSSGASSGGTGSLGSTYDLIKSYLDNGSGYGSGSSVFTSGEYPDYTNAGVQDAMRQYAGLMSGGQKTAAQDLLRQVGTAGVSRGGTNMAAGGSPQASMWGQQMSNIAAQTPANLQQGYEYLKSAAEFNANQSDNQLQALSLLANLAQTDYQNQFQSQQYADSQAAAERAYQDQQEQNDYMRTQAEAAQQAQKDAEQLAYWKSLMTPDAQAGQQNRQNMLNQQAQEAQMARNDLWNRTVADNPIMSQYSQLMTAINQLVGPNQSYLNKGYQYA